MQDAKLLKPPIGNSPDGESIRDLLQYDLQCVPTLEQCVQGRLLQSVFQIVLDQSAGPLRVADGPIIVSGSHEKFRQ